MASVSISELLKASCHRIIHLTLISHRYQVVEPMVLAYSNEKLVDGVKKVL